MSWLTKLWPFRFGWIFSCIFFGGDPQRSALCQRSAWGLPIDRFPRPLVTFADARPRETPKGSAQEEAEFADTQKRARDFKFETAWRTKGLDAHSTYAQGRSV